MSNVTSSIERIRLVSHLLGDLSKKAVFVGGATIPFYIPNTYWPQARATEDVDIVLEILSHQENWRMDEELRKKGFANDTREGAPLCRWLIKGITVDIMSVEEKIFGFTNKWYKEGFEKAIKLSAPLPEVKVLPLLYFLATKIEAFQGRGKNDFLGSHDMEDIISLLEVAPSKDIYSNIKVISKDLKKYLASELAVFKENSSFLDAIPGSVFNRVQPQEGFESVLRNMETIILECTSG